MRKKVNIISNETELSKKTYHTLLEKLDKKNFIITDHFEKDADLTICIGGDGIFLDSVADYNFPVMPIVGINTGHLGFFQEILPNMIDEFIYSYMEGDYSIQELLLVEAEIYLENGEKNIHYAVNEISVRGPHTNLIHLNMSIGDNFIERYSGDGLVVATPAGSTAYNYSLGGSIVDPRLCLLQITPIAPSNTTAYRSFTSSLIISDEETITLIPESRFPGKKTYVVYDGYETKYTDIEKIKIKMSNKTVKLMKFQNSDDFWAKVKNKFL